MTLTVETAGTASTSVEQMDDDLVAPFVLPPEPPQGLEEASAKTVDTTFHFPTQSASTGARRGSWIRQPIVLPAPREINRRFKPLARWEGAVTEVFGTYFLAEVVDLDNDERAMVEFDLDEISESDKPLCQPGRLFYWSVGYDIKESGQLSRASVVRFRRLGHGSSTA